MIPVPRGIAIGLVVIVAVLLLPGATSAAKVWRIGFLGSASPSSGAPFVEAFRQGLRAFGHVEGQNITVEYRWAHGKVEALPGLATELLQLNVDLIFAGSTAAALAAKSATKTVPIVFAGAADPVGTGLVTHLARPGGNLTGVSTANVELVAKRLQLIGEIAPTKVSRLGVLFNPGDVSNVVAVREMDAPARALGITLRSLEVRSAQDSYGNRLYVEHGGLMSYATDVRDHFRRAGAYIDRILKGAKPADLPIEQPTKFELVINLKAAKTLGLTIPPAVLAQADTIVE